MDADTVFIASLVMIVLIPLLFYLSVLRSAFRQSAARLVWICFALLVNPPLAILVVFVIGWVKCRAWGICSLMRVWSAVVVLLAGITIALSYLEQAGGTAMLVVAGALLLVELGIAVFSFRMCLRK